MRFFATCNAESQTLLKRFEYPVYDSGLVIPRLQLHVQQGLRRVCVRRNLGHSPDGLCVTSFSCTV